MSGQLIQFRGIGQISDQTWPANRQRGDFRRERREQAELELRITYCGFCGAQSPLLDGPTGRAWFNSHRCGARGDAA